MKKKRLFHNIFTIIRICLWLCTISITIAIVMFCRDYIQSIFVPEKQAIPPRNVSVSVSDFTESARELSNPDRGTYRIYGFVIKDELTDYKELVADKFKNDHATTLSMLQINLCQYNAREISPLGLDNIASLFDALRSLTDKRFLVRFLYDWDGKISQTEPESIDIILGHMRQLEPVIRQNSDKIFVMQGNFTGNWGEMNGSRFSSKEDLQALMGTLASVTDERTFLSVRTPYQWRSTTDIIDFTSDTLLEHPYAWRFGLYNDGILGNITDCGTYSETSRAEGGDISIWNREEELAFQNQLCQYVPNGGETIVNNPMNDFENALPALRQMHITFLNQDYDQSIFRKWAQSTVDDGSVYDGMDGYSYITRHLGYRILVDSAELDYHADKDMLMTRINLRNVGFAPLYGSKEGRLTLYRAVPPELTDETDSLSDTYDSYYIYRFTEDVSALSRVNSEEEIFSLELGIPLAQLPAGSYTVFFQLWDNETDSQLALALENTQTAFGYEAGSFTITDPEPLPEPTPTLPELPDLPFDLDSRIEEFFRPNIDADTDMR